MAALEEDVLGLDVAVEHALRVGVGKRVRHLPGDAHGFLNGQLLLAIQPVAERLSLHHGHDVVKEPGDLTRIVERQDVRVTQVRCRPDLSQEPLGAQRR